MQFGCFTHQLWLAHPRDQLLTDKSDCELGEVESTEHHNRHVCGLHQKLGVHERALNLTAHHVEGGDNVLSASLTSLRFLLGLHAHLELLLPLSCLLFHLHLLVESLLLDRCFQLVFVFQSLAPQVLLLGDTLFVFLAALATHLLLL